MNVKIMCAFVTASACLLAQTAAQRAFPSAADATQSLYQAVQSNDGPAIENILGGPSELASTHDEAQDKMERALFVEKYKEMHRLAREADGSVTLYIGAENWPFPIPLVAAKQAWRFDPETGSKEVLFRRIGDNELTAIVTCHELVAEEMRYRAMPHTETELGISPASLVAKTAGESKAGEPILSHGYYFQSLTRQPNPTGQKATRFAFIAYPADYRSSGVMTFIVTEKDVVYQKDLGPDTSKLARGMTEFRKDSTWRVADE